MTDFHTNPNQPIQTSAHIREQHNRIDQLKKALANIHKKKTIGRRSEEFGFREDTSTLKGTLCTVSGFPNLPVEELLSKLPHHCEIIAGESFHVLVHSPVSRRWSKVQLFCIVLLIVFILLSIFGWKRGYNVRQFIRI